MALFQDTRELSRQAQHVGMDKVTGFRKTAMSALGYKDDGTFKGGYETIGGRLLAGQLSKGSDAKEVLKETRDEFWAKKGSQAKFAFETAKLATTMGVGGGAGGILKGASEKVGNAVGNAVGKKTGSEIMSRAADTLASNLTEQGIEGAQDLITKKADDIIGNKTDSELLKSLDDDAPDEDELLDELDQEDIEEDGKRKTQENMKKVLGYVPLIGGVATSGIQALGTARAQHQEADRIADSFKAKTAKDTGFNLL